jgi:hypothetical protein
MTDLIEGIGPVLGVAAFLGLSILAFLIFQQAREVRRLREWAGRAPERASDAAEASAAAAEARGEAPGDETEVEPAAATGRFASLRERLEERFGPAWEELDRRSPADPRYFLAVIAAAVIAAAILTGGFGAFGGEEGKHGNGGKQSQKSEKVRVAVLNATQEQSAAGGTIAGVPGLADEVAKQVVKPAGFEIGAKTNASSGFQQTVIMFEDGEEKAAQELADSVADQLGETQVEPIVPEVADLADGAKVVLVVGQDDANALGSSSQ